MDVMTLLQQYLLPYRRVQATGLPPQLGRYPARGPRPDMDELLDYKPYPFQHPDQGIVARPYTGSETGDPVLGLPRYGTWDRPPIDANDPQLPLWRFWRGW